MPEKRDVTARGFRSRALYDEREIIAGVTADLRREYPELWNLACEFDFAERLGGCTDPLRAEADRVLSELWTARTNQVTA